MAPYAGRDMRALARRFNPDFADWCRGSASCSTRRTVAGRPAPARGAADAQARLPRHRRAGGRAPAGPPDGAAAAQCTLTSHRPFSLSLRPRAKRGGKPSPSRCHCARSEAIPLWFSSSQCGRIAVAGCGPAGFRRTAWRLV